VAFQLNVVLRMSGQSAECYNTVYGILLCVRVCGFARAFALLLVIENTTNIFFRRFHKFGSSSQLKFQATTHLHPYIRYSCTHRKILVLDSSPIKYLSEEFY
jgi:hypothetical protein